MPRKRLMMKNMQPKKYFTSILILAVITVLCGCRECLPVNTDKYTPTEIEALRIVKELRAVVAEVHVHDTKSKAHSVAQLCRLLQYMRETYRSPRLIELADALPVAWINDPEVNPGIYGGYRFVLVTGVEQGVYAIPYPAGPPARFLFYARLPAGLFLRKAEGFKETIPAVPPGPGKDGEWRPVPVVK